MNANDTNVFRALNEIRFNRRKATGLGLTAALGFALRPINVFAEESEDDTRVITLVDGRSPDPRTTTVDEDLGVPPYEDTGVGKTKTWKLSVPEGWTLIVGGTTVKVGSTAHDKGFMTVIEGPADEETYKVTDGFYKYITSDGAWDEFCMRLQQHRDNGWLISEVEIPKDWDMCPGVTTPETTPDEGKEEGGNVTQNDDGTVTLSEGDENVTTVNGRNRVDAVSYGSDVIPGRTGDWGFAESIGDADGAVVCSNFCAVANATSPFVLYGGLKNPTVAEWNTAVSSGDYEIVEI